MELEIVRRIIEQIIAAHTTAGDYAYRFYLQYSRPILDGLHLGFDSLFKVFLFITMLVATSYLIMALAAMMKKKTTTRPVKKGKEPTVTVQIPTYNELAAINCAKRCLAFDYPRERLQIIIGDDSSDRSVSAKIDAFAAQYPGRIEVTRRGNNVGYKPGNLNHMLKYSNGDILVIFDSDFLPDKDFLRKITSPFAEDKDIAVAQARWKIVNFRQNAYSVLGGTITAMCHHLALSFIDWFKGNSFLCGSAEAIRKKDLLDIGGWEAGSLTEDIECSLRLNKGSKKLVYLEDVDCGCEAPQSFRDLYRQQMRWSFGVTAAMKKHLGGILRSPKIPIKDKFGILLFGSGYLFSFMLFFLTVFGSLAVISNAPAPVDWSRFLSETAFNIIITSGILLASIVALAKSRMVKSIPKMLAASLSIGIAVTYFVNIGILKALFDRKMNWFMLKKNGNRTVN
ncbi:MAG: glycosyltransferase [DPANN group archaeon]|nr:glycosyltransferase [DPANN group archaeon]